MSQDAAELPDDVDSLRRLLRERSVERDLAYEALKIKTLEVERLKMQLAKLRRMQFGRSSEKLDGQIAQLELAIEELEFNEAPFAAPAAAGETVENTTPGLKSFNQAAYTTPLVDTEICGSFWALMPRHAQR